MIGYNNVRSFGAAGDGVADDTTKIQAAIDALPASGGVVFFLPGTYKITAALILPDQSITFMFASGTVIAPSGTISVFSVPDGLTAPRTYWLYGNPTVTGVPGDNQTLFQLDDANGYGNFEVSGAVVTDMGTLVDWTQYDTNYSNQSVVRFRYSTITSRSTGSVLASTPNPAGTYGAPVALKLEKVILPVPAAGNQWTADADCDLWIEDVNFPNFTTPFSMNGLEAKNTIFFFKGAGDNNFYGNGWDIYDYLDKGSGFVTQQAASGSAADGRVIFGGGFMKIDASIMDSTALQFLGLVECSIRVLFDSIGLSNPGIELLNGASEVNHCFFRKGSAPATCFGQGAIKITSVFNCSISHNHFEPTLTGKTVLETGTADKNCIHDNTGFAAGTGNTVNINGNDQVHNNIN